MLRLVKQLKVELQAVIAKQKDYFNGEVISLPIMSAADIWGRKTIKYITHENETNLIRSKNEWQQDL